MGSQGTPTPVVSMEALNERFERAVRVGARLGNLGAQARLDLYGLYKQATVGDCASKQPSAIKAVERAKWDAWNKLSGMTETAAKHLYVELVKQLEPSFQATDDVDTADDEQAKYREAPEEETLEEPSVKFATNNVSSMKSSSPEVASEQIAAVSVAANNNIRSALRTIAARPSRSPSSSDSPIPTWAVFLLGVIFLCILDDNLSLSNIIVNGLGVSVFTGAIISLQLN